MEAAGCYGRNCADDVCADAALLSRAVGRPVRVQLTREQEHVWEPKGTAQLMEVDGGLDAAGHPVAYDFRTYYPSNGAPTLALLLTGRVEPLPVAYEMGDRTSVPPYEYPALRVSIEDMAPIVRASGCAAFPPCRTPSLTNLISMSWPTPPASIRWNTGCAISMTNAPVS